MKLLSILKIHHCSSLPLLATPTAKCDNAGTERVLWEVRERYEEATLLRYSTPYVSLTPEGVSAL